LDPILHNIFLALLFCLPAHRQRLCQIKLPVSIYGLNITI